MPSSFIAWLDDLGVKVCRCAGAGSIPIMGCNVLAIAPRSAIMLENLPGVKSGLEQAGCTVATYKGLEISRKGEGGPTCLTRPLKRL
jgi:N-dimethylarginine dimethylaminohydrolase